MVYNWQHIKQFDGVKLIKRHKIQQSMENWSVTFFFLVLNGAFSRKFNIACLIMHRYNVYSLSLHFHLT